MVDTMLPFWRLQHLELELEPVESSIKLQQIQSWRKYRLPLPINERKRHSTYKMIHYGFSSMLSVHRS